MRVAVFVAVCLLLTVACAPPRGGFTFYTVVTPEQGEKFITAVTSIAKENGLDTEVGRATSDTGSVLKVVEGRGFRLRLWAQSVPLSGHEDPTLCGLHDEPYPDPAQFIIYAQPTFLAFDDGKSAADLGKKAFSELKALGFDVRREAAICGIAALGGRS
jgi:hypothetical protein